MAVENVAKRRSPTLLRFLWRFVLVNFRPCNVHELCIITCSDIRTALIGGFDEAILVGQSCKKKNQPRRLVNQVVKEVVEESSVSSLTF